MVDELGIPVKFVGVGESLEDLQPFDAEAFVDAIFSWCIFGKKLRAEPNGPIIFSTYLKQPLLRKSKAVHIQVSSPLTLYRQKPHSDIGAMYVVHHVTWAIKISHQSNFILNPLKRKHSLSLLQNDLLNS